MSHTTEVRSVVFKDIDALKMAVKEMQADGLRCSLLENTKPRAYYQAQSGMGVAPYVLNLHDSRYDVGFYYDDKLQAHVARTDLFGGDVAAQLGNKGKASTQAGSMGKLYQSYAVNAACRQAAKQGYRVRRHTKEDGTVQLTMNVGA